MAMLESWLQIKPNGPFQRIWSSLKPDSKAVPIVILHEGLGCLELWRDFPARLETSFDRSIYAFEREGYGKSGVISGAPNPYYLDEEVKIALPAFLDHLNIEKAILLGHSDGGTISLKFASLFPHRVEAIITMAAHVYTDPISLQGIYSAIKAYEQGEFKSKLQRYHGDGIDGIFYRWAHTWTQDRFSDWNMIQELPQVSCPTLAIQGEDDHYGEPRQIETICRHVSGSSKALLIPKCGHSPHLEAPQVVLSNIREFLSELS